MKRSFWIYGLFGFAVTALGGTLLHFLYDLLGEALWIAPFSGVNESTFEHMKLMFWPMFAFALLERLFIQEREDFWCVKLRGILLALTLIPLLFYTYNGVIGKSPDFVNISIFFVSAAIAYAYETRLFNLKKLDTCRGKLAFIAISVIAILFVTFTFMPPKIGLFLDPVTGKYGI